MKARIEFICPGGKDGLYAHPTQCDRYFHCVNKRAKRRLCPDGLVFDPLRAEAEDPCNHIHNTKDKCKDRLTLQRPQPGDANCPRQNGVYPSPDVTECDKFYSCLKGVGSIQVCAEGLHFDPKSGTCVWPRESSREGCLSETQRSRARKPTQRRQKQPQTNNDNKKGDSLPNGFTCPGGKLGIHLALPHPTSCRLYYNCLNGVTPIEAGCGPGLVFNDVTAKCDDPSNVPRCQSQVRSNKRPKKSQAPQASANGENLNINQISEFLKLLQTPSIRKILKPEIVEALSNGESNPQQQAAAPRPPVRGF